MEGRAVDLMPIMVLVVHGEDGRGETDGGEGAAGDEEGLEAVGTDVGDESVEGLFSTHKREGKKEGGRERDARYVRVALAWIPWSSFGQPVDEQGEESCEPCCAGNEREESQLGEGKLGALGPWRGHVVETGEMGTEGNMVELRDG